MKGLYGLIKLSFFFFKVPASLDQVFLHFRTELQVLQE